MLQRRAVAWPLAIVFSALVASGCVNDLVTTECDEQNPCAAGQCVMGKCELSASVDMACSADEECDVANGERCVASVCQVLPEGAEPCNLTADCPMEQYCGSAVGLCQPLMEGWCRTSQQCTGNASVCTTENPGVPGRCVECIANADCGDGFSCVNPGVCEASAPVGGRPGDGGGDTGTGTGGGDTGGGGTGGDTGGGDTGGGNTGGGDTGGGNTGGGDTGGGNTGGGDTGGGDTGGGGGTTDPCEIAGVYGDGGCDLNCPQPDPDCADDTGGGTGGTGGGGAGTCSQNNDCWNQGFSINYSCNAGTCACDTAWLQQFSCQSDQVVDVTSCSCVAPGGGGDTGGGDTGGGGGNTGGDSDDLCVVFNYYNDGVCDTFCSQPDPDCSATGGGGDTGGGGTGGGDTGGGGTGGLLENQSCVDPGGVVRQCAAGLECVWVGDANNNPLYGSCKQYCSTDAECGAGRSCAAGFLANGLGICGTPKVSGETGCNFWEQGDAFCFDANTPSGGGWALLECLAGTCGYICDYQGNQTQMLCPLGSCSEPIYDYQGYDIPLGVCEF